MTSGNGRNGYVTGDGKHLLSDSDMRCLAVVLGFGSAHEFREFVEYQDAKADNEKLAKYLRDELGYKERAIQRELAGRTNGVR